MGLIGLSLAPSLTEKGMTRQAEPGRSSTAAPQILYDIYFFSIFFLTAVGSSLVLNLCQDVNEVFNAALGFFNNRDFAVNFVANLGGAMIGVLLAFWIERFRVRRETRMLYGRLLRTSRSELGYLKPMYVSTKKTLEQGRKYLGAPDTSAAATRALLVNPVVHDQAPHSLIMVLTVMCHHFDITESAFGEGQKLKPQDAAVFAKILTRQLENAIDLISIVIEQIDSQLNLLGLEKTPDGATQEISKRLHEILRRPFTEGESAAQPEPASITQDANST